MALPPGGAAGGGGDAPIDAQLGAQPSDDMGDDDAQVLLTVLKGPDGSYVLVKGDEDDDDQGDMSEDDVAAGAGGGGSGDQGQHFSSVGALLKGILDLINEDAAGSGGPGGSDEDQFAAGFASPNAPTPKPAAGARRSM